MGLLKSLLVQKKQQQHQSRKRPFKRKKHRHEITVIAETKGSHEHKQRETQNNTERKRKAHVSEVQEDEGSSAFLKDDGNNNNDDIILDGIRTVDTKVDDEFEDVSSMNLVRSLHSKDLPLERKIDVAYRFVESLKEQQQSLNFTFQWEKSWFGMSQLVSLLCYWVQSILISSRKSNTALQISTHRDACLDVRCWVILKWCLQSKYLERPSFNSNLMCSMNVVFTIAMAFPHNRRENDIGCPLVSDESIKHEPEMIIRGALIEEFTEVVGLLFSLHRRYFRPTLDLWTSSALAVVNIGERVFLREVHDDYKFVLLKLTCLVLEEFARYLGSHPNPRNVFPVIVEKLLEPLLLLLVVLERKPCPREFSGNDIFYSWRIRLVRIVEDIFAFGLFHSVHIDGYLNICKIDSYGETETDVKAKKKAKSASSRKHEREDSSVSFVSYHKSLFQKLEYLRKEGKLTALHVIGRLLSIFICRKKNQGAGASQFIGTGRTKTLEISGESLETININKEQQDISHSVIRSGTSGGTAKNSYMHESNLTALEHEVHASKQDQPVATPLINLFVEFMEPLEKELEEFQGFVEGQKIQQLSHAQSMLVAINGLLAVVKDEKIYVPTEDTPGQAHFNYLKRIYNTIFKLGALVAPLCCKVVYGIDIMGTDAYDKSFKGKQPIHDPGSEKLPTMIMKDIVLALSCLLEIEYKVAEDKLLNLWLLLLFYLAVNSSGNKEQEKSSVLSSQIVSLGCQIISIYAELRQIGRPLFRLFESIRFFIFGSNKRTIEKEHQMLLSSTDSLPSTLRVQAVVSLACSQEFLNIVAAVVAAVPEGQVSQCIRLLKVDVMETLEWVKHPCMKGDVKESKVMIFQNQTKQDLTVQAEVVGKALSEIYIVILDKSNLTVNNSIQVGNSVKEIVTFVSSCLGTFVEKASKNVECLWQFILSVITGNKTFKNKDEDREVQARVLLWSSWILVFIFRLYLSCRSLYQQCVSFMPPNSAKKSSLAMGDLFTACSGHDWIQEGGNFTEGGYFSWIDKPSVSVAVVLKAISESLEQGGFGKAPALFYVLHNIALQRLVDLNRRIKALEFLHDKTVRFIRAIGANNNDLPTQCREQKRLEKLIKVSRQEASSLTNFILNDAFSLVAEKVESKSCLADLPDNIMVCEWNSVIGTLDEHSLVTAIWQLVCHNVDIWSYHASKKSRKKFVSKLLGSFLSFQRRVSSDANSQLIQKHVLNERKVVMMEEISSELLRNVVLYEQEFFCRYLAPKICQNITKSLPSKLNHLSFLRNSPAEDVFGNLQDWSKFLEILEEVGRMALCKNNDNCKHGSTITPLPEVIMEKYQVVASCEQLFGDWINLLNLMCWLPKGYGGVKSLSIYAQHILDIERFLVITLHQAQKASDSDPLAVLQSSGIGDPTELLDLFLACRRALKSVTLSDNDDKFQDIRLSLVPILFESSSSCLWLMRSVDVVAQCFSEFALLRPSLKRDLKGNITIWEHLLFSILDHTAGMLMTVCEGLFNIAAKSLIFNVQCASDICKGDKLSGAAQSSATDPIFKSKNYMDVQAPINVLAETLSVQARDTVVYLKQRNFEADFGLHDPGMNYSIQVSETGKTYSGSWIGVIALTGGVKSIIWGLASALDNVDEKCRKDKTGSLKWKKDLLTAWEHYIESFEYFVNLCIKKFLLVDTFNEAVITKRNVVASRHDSNATFRQYMELDAEPTEYDIEENLQIKFAQKEESEMEEEKDEAEENNVFDDIDKDEEEEYNGGAENSFLRDVHALKDYADPADSFGIPYLNKFFLEKLLKGENPGQATLLGELFMALAGLVKLKHLSSSPKVLSPTTDIQSMSLEFTDFHIGAAHWLILEASKITRSSGAFSLGWLVGIVRYLESIGSFIPYMNSMFPRMAYAKLINLHLEAMASVCFPHSVEVKTLVPHEVQYNNDNPYSSESTMQNKRSCIQVNSDTLNDLKTALRNSFAMLVRKPLHLHLFLALQSIERALSGAWAKNNIASELHSGSQNGGRVGRMVAAGVECLDLALDSVSGPKRLKLLAKHSSTFVADLLNIIVHIQGPQIFFVSGLDQCQNSNDADPALVTLACVEVLLKVASRHTVFQMSASHVGQSLAFPALLFQHLCQFNSSQCVIPGAMSLQNQCIDIKKATLLSEGTSGVASKVSVELYISCCRLLSALLRHRKRESGHCIALLGDSLRIFLYCLEIVDRDMPAKLNSNIWTVEEGVKCASWLRRVYEEMGQHKETLGRYCLHILSDYICVLSGCGPAKTGINREIDEALRPGAYVLVDACSLEDLQQLHAVLGEGPRRNALQTLRHDYERHFKYSGKI